MFLEKHRCFIQAVDQRAGLVVGRKNCPLTRHVHGEIDQALAARDIADRIEDNIDELFPGAEVFIHVEPAGTVHRRILRMP